MRKVDQEWMATALRLARKGYYTADPNPRVGCVVVKDNQLVASGWHEFTGGAHAEAMAIAAATIPAGADFFVTLEPCSHHGRTPPCVDAVIAQHPQRVVVAMQDPNPQVCGRGLQKIRDQGIEVVCGVLEAEARQLNRGFCKRMQQGLPFVSLKMAASLDGRSALANGASKWITGKAARRDVQLLRAQSSAILSSAKTVMDDNARLTVRLSSQDLGQAGNVRQPLRVIVDAGLELSGDEALFEKGGAILVYTISVNAKRIDRLRAAGAEVVPVAAATPTRLDLLAMLQDLAARGVNQLHCECGPNLAGGLIQQELVDQVIIYMAPHLLGSQAQGLFELGELRDLQQRKQCHIDDIRMVGEDLRLSLTLENN